MGKLTEISGNDPHEGGSDNWKKEPSRFKTNLKQKRPYKYYPYFADPLMVPRVKQYLEDCSQKSFVDIDDMVDELQRKYKDYSKKKRNAFKNCVQKAFSVVLQSTQPEGQHRGSSSESSEEELEEFDEEDEELYDESNIANEQLASLYKLHPRLEIQQSLKGNHLLEEDDDGEKELINISSDEEVESSKDIPSEETPPVKKQTANPPVRPVEPRKSLQINSSVAPLPSYKQVPTRPAPPLQQIRKRKAENDVGSGSPQKKKRELALNIPTVNFSDVGGSEKCLMEVCKLLVHMRHPEVYSQLGISPPRGFLLHGPPGSGKTLLANAIAGELNMPLMKVAAPELVAGVSGESEERIRELFDQAAASAPCILFIDEVDAITPHRHTAQREMERRIVAQLLSCLDELGLKENGDRVLVIGATNRPDSLDPALRRSGRFDREVCLGIPDEKARENILRVVCRRLKLAPNFDFKHLSRFTPGFVGADLMALTREASMTAVNRVFGDLQSKPVKVKIEEMSEVTKSKEVTEVAMDTDAKGDESVEEATTSVPQEKEQTSVQNTTEEQKMDIAIEPTNKESSNSKNIVSESVEKESSSEINALSDSVEKICSNEKNVASTPCNKDSHYEPNLEELMAWLHEQPPLSNQQLQELCIEMRDFKAALKCVQPSAKREGFITVPDVTWDDVGALRDVRDELEMSIMAPVKHPEQFEMLGLSSPSGVLLCGPPGCGKTLLAKAVANEAGINFISVKGPELLNMYVGESEKAVRQCFQRARNSAPCVIFFDELDALCPKRTNTGEGGASMRVVNQLLTEMDGIEGRKGVFLMAATNRPDIVDPAVLRPGRLDKILYIGLPTPTDRVEILKALTKNGTKPHLSPKVNLKLLGLCEQCSGYTGADLAALVREASITALKEYLLVASCATELIVEDYHFKVAFEKIRPSVSLKDRKHYEMLKEAYAVRANLVNGKTEGEQPGD